MTSSNSGALRLILGDQLAFNLASLVGIDIEQDRVLLAEVTEEARHVPHHPQKIAFLFSAMRHFAEALRARGVRVEYVTLDDPANCGSLVGELQRHVECWQPASIHITEAGDWRVEQSLRESGLPITWYADTRFICSREAFERWAQGKKQLRMEFFYREMRRKTGLLLEPDGSPLGGAWNFDADNRKPLPKGLRVPLPCRFARDGITDEVLALVAERFADHYGSLEAFDYPRLPMARLKPCGSIFSTMPWRISAIIRTPWPAASRSCSMHGSVPHSTSACSMCAVCTPTWRPPSMRGGWHSTPPRASSDS